jgi:hypothetical protein
LNLDYFPVATVSILCFAFRIDKKIQKNLKGTLTGKRKILSKRLGYNGRLMINNKKEK